MFAKIWYRKADTSLDSISIPEKDRYDLHDGYVRYRDDDGNWTVLPMHRVLWIEE